MTIISDALRVETILDLQKLTEETTPRRYDTGIYFVQDSGDGSPIWAQYRADSTDTVSSVILYPKDGIEADITDEGRYHLFRSGSAIIGGSAGSVAWGSLTGNLADQTDLDSALSGIATNSSDISNLTSRVTTNENDITSIDGRITTNENDITSIDGRITTNENDITSIEGRVTTNESDITSIDGRVTTNEGNITSIDGRVTSLENSPSGGVVSTKIPGEYILYGGTLDASNAGYTLLVSGVIQLFGEWFIDPADTIGKGSSSADVNLDDLEDLFKAVWNRPDVIIIGGKGTSSGADWNANKAIILPDFAARSIVATGNNGAATRNQGDFWGNESVVISPPYLPALAPTFVPRNTAGSADTVRNVFWGANGAALPMAQPSVATGKTLWAVGVRV